jgi:NTP pyrophosphatase (non-canonical NTP hydrolase)
VGYQILTKVYKEVDDECQRQIKKHGDKSMYHRSTHDAIAPLTEELGEVAKAECDWWDGRSDNVNDIRKELIQLAACAINMIKHMDSYVEEYFKREEK